MSNLKDFINEGRQLHGIDKLDEKLSASDKLEVKESKGLTKEEKVDFLELHALSEKTEKWKSETSKVWNKMKSDSGTKAAETADEHVINADDALGDVIDSYIDKINKGMNESEQYDIETLALVIEGENEYSELESLDEAELSPLQTEYREYFKDVLASFDVTSPAKLSFEKTKEFFNKIKEGWVKGKGRKDKE
tara:strand:+ start:1608 stop:2186 length:579 start_codon:yes stop_codon:yes gene_type:complete